MTSIGMEFLSGTCRAESRHARGEAEWPPHPDRLFMALVSAHHVHRPSEPEATQEREALLWLESQSPPKLAVELRVAHRSSPVSYVPSNDDRMSLRGRAESASDAKIEAQLRLLPARRGRKGRRFSVATPLDPVVHFIWDDRPPSKSAAEALARLCVRVTHFGPASSMVRCWLESSPPAPTLQPREDFATLRLRIPTAGRLSVLESAYASAPEELPPVATYKSYGPTGVVGDPPRCRLGAQLLMLAIRAGREASLEQTLAACELLRQAILARCPAQPPPEWISGHQRDGRPSTEDHIAIAPIADVGAARSTGRLLGFLILVPAGVELIERRMSLEPAVSPDFGEETLRLGSTTHPFIHWELSPTWVIHRDPPIDEMSLRGGPAGARVWATITPIAFDRHHRAPDAIAGDIAVACNRVGLPTPRRIALVTNSPISGTLPAGRMPMLGRVGGGRLRRHVHAVIEFSNPVQGPVAIGAGRFRGYGSMLPWPRAQDSGEFTWIDLDTRPAAKLTEEGTDSPEPRSPEAEPDS